MAAIAIRAEEDEVVRRARRMPESGGERARRRRGRGAELNNAAGGCRAERAREGRERASERSLLKTKQVTSPSEGSSDDEVPEISKCEAIIWLGIMTAWISVLSEYLVDAIMGASVAWKMPIAFISVILLPIVGNAAEHASAIMFAMKNKLDISIGVAIGSSTQISMFAIPFCVVVGWIMGRPMDLNFQLFETATLFITVLVVAILVQEGTSNYFKGLMLILCYLIVAASFYVHVDPPSDALNP